MRDPELARVFLAAQGHLWDGHGKASGGMQRFVCNAVKLVDSPKAGLALQVVEAIIAPAWVLEVWRLHHHHPPADVENRVSMQGYRKQFLQDLYEAFK